MNITFLIGNGFDIGLGMISKFKDFFPIYQEKSRHKTETIKQLADNIGDDYDTWADFESALGNYTLSFDNVSKQNFIDQIKDFEKEFINYLREKELELEFDDNENIGDMIRSALTQYYSAKNVAPESSNVIRNIYSAHGSENHTYNFVNFNYTFTLEKCLKTLLQDVVCKRKISTVEKVDKIGKIVHVHGNCNLFPIIGVNDVSQIANKELAEDESFTRYIVKPDLNALLRQGNDTYATSLINQSTIVCIYGMSLGVTDKKWWELLIKWLSANPARQLVIYNYDDKYTTFTQFDWLEKEDSVLDKLKEYNTDSRINVDLLRSRIHIAVHKNIFEMDIPIRDKDRWQKVYEQIKTEKQISNI